MPTFAYQAVDSVGRRSKGRLVRSSADAVVKDLEEKGLLALGVSEEAAVSSSGFGFGRKGAVLEFTRAVAALLPAGMPLSRALAASTATAPESIRPTLDDVRARVDRGSELADAFAQHPRIFSSLYVGMVRAGEKSGSLDQAFGRLSEHLEREGELRSKLVSMSIYPVLLALVGVGAVMVLVFFVLPRFSDLLTSSGAPLPTSTAAVVGLANFAQEQWWILVALPTVLLLLTAWAQTTRSGQSVASRALVSAPLVGRWRRQTLGARFARMVGELLSGGAPVLAALGDARDCMTDPVAREETDRIRTQVREGSPLHAAIAARGVFPPVLTQLVMLGEEAGRLSDFLIKAAELLERKTERSIERMVAVAEPAMIVGFGGVVAVVALALLQAIYGVNAGSF